MLKTFHELEKHQKIHLAILAFVLFLLLFSYPIIRSTTTALFIESFGAKSTPLVWIFSVLTLALFVSVNNFLQLKFTIQALFLNLSLATILILAGGVWLFENGVSWMPYPLYVWKEVYIVLLVHMAIGYLNATLTLEQAKLFYGPFGALGSIGGIAGGLLTSFLTKSMTPEKMLLFGLIFIFLAGLVFWQTDRRYDIAKSKRSQKKESPLASIVHVRKYVFFVVAVIVLSQFCISLVNFKFNLLFEALVETPALKTAYLGKLYATINAVSLFVQLALIPYVLSHFTLQRVHQSIPSLYLVAVLVTLLGPSSWLFLLSGSFILMKAMDYSLFAAAKELLYFPLSKKQKYGAKYIADMIFYRFAKGLISFVLLFFQSHFAVNTLLLTCLGLWFLTLIPLFHQAKQLTSKGALHEPSLKS